MYEPYNEETASDRDKAAWILCQIIDGDAPMRWTRYRGVVACMVANSEFKDVFEKLVKES